jgi:hypothetical protein
MTSDQVVVVRRWRGVQPLPASIKTLKELSEYAPKKIGREEWLKRGMRGETEVKTKKAHVFRIKGWILDPWGS